MEGMVTLVHSDLPVGAIHKFHDSRQTRSGEGMAATATLNHRIGNRTKAVLPIKIKGTDQAGNTFEELVHTLDLTALGVRLGSVRRELNTLDELTVFYRQRKMQFRVVWTKKMRGTSEFQVGLQSTTNDREAWGLALPDRLAVSRASGQ